MWKALVFYFKSNFFFILAHYKCGRNILIIKIIKIIVTKNATPTVIPIADNILEFLLFFLSVADNGLEGLLFFLSIIVNDSIFFMTDRGI